MRDGRRKRLGLQEGTEGTVGDTYLDRILSDEQAASLPTYNLGEADANVLSTDQRQYSDAYNFFLGGGFPQEEEPVIDTPIVDTTPVVDTSGEGQATLPGFDDPIPEPITPVVAPGEYPSTQDEMDEFNAIPVTQPNTGGVTNDNIIVENIAQNQNPYDEPMDMDDPGASIENIIAQQNQTISDDPSIDAFDINEVGDPSQNMLDVPTQDVGLAYTGEFDPNDEGTVYSNELENFEPEQQGLIDQAFSKVGSTAENIMDDLSKIPGAVVDFANQTVDIFGKKINVGSTLSKAGINKLVGGPISLVFDAAMALGKMLPKDSLDTIDTSDDRPQDPGPSGFVGLDPDMDVDPFEFDDMNYEPPSTPTGTDRPGGDRDPAPSAPQAKPAAPVYQDAIMRGQSGGGSDSSGGGGKIVCTMMNESYGFGSFRNKIWMKFHKDLAPEYQKGYHKLFLPLVRIAKTNKVVKKVLEHIAVHSTIDMRQATRGKTHLLGRVYRKIILPLCYWAGKND